MERPGQMDPEPAELFVMEWRLKVDQVTDDHIGDPGVAFFSDGAWAVGFRYAEDHLVSVFEGHQAIPIPAGLWHDYRLTSADMRTYDLYIDEDLAREGAFSQVVSQSYAGWGDAVQGAASLHHWDYFRFGSVAPEPSGFLLIVAVLARRVAGLR
jgi:hypothetical protein